MNATLALQGTRAATGDFPLGLPLGAAQQSVVPLDLTFSFSDVPGLAGTVGVDAGRLGTPTFGPMLLTRGDLRVLR